MRIQPRPFSKLTVTALSVAAALTPAAAVGRTTSGPPAAMIKSTYNLCKVARVQAIAKAAGKKYTPCSGDANRIFYWPRVGGGGGLALYVQAGAKSAGKDDPKLGTSKSVQMPGASKAVLTTYKDRTKRLYAVYPQGVVGVTEVVETALSDAQLQAVLRVMTHT